jgi:hypothetical protein
VVGTEYVDEMQEPARQLVAVIGHVGSEIGVAAIRFHQRAVDVVAKVGGLEQCLLAVLPLFVLMPFGFGQAPLVNETLRTQLLDGGFDLVLARGQRPF